MSKFASHWAPHSYGLVAHLSWKLSKLQPIWTKQELEFRRQFEVSSLILATLKIPLVLIYIDPCPSFDKFNGVKREILLDGQLPGFQTTLPKFASWRGNKYFLVLICVLVRLTDAMNYKNTFLLLQETFLKLFSIWKRFKVKILNEKE